MNEKLENARKGYNPLYHRRDRMDDKATRIRPKSALG